MCISLFGLSLFFLADLFIILLSLFIYVIKYIRFPLFCMAPYQYHLNVCMFYLFVFLLFLLWMCYMDVLLINTLTWERGQRGTFDSLSLSPYGFSKCCTGHLLKRMNKNDRSITFSLAETVIYNQMCPAFDLAVSIMSRSASIDISS